ncbi:MAG: radical SAM protein [Candidatus Omnitrophica bacterium]|nr:radical SAM protein [Candidatus Omnitrophota bacterium]
MLVLKKILHKPTRYPYFAQIDITNVCNLQCRMCPIHYLGIEKTHIDYEIFKRIVDNLGEIEEVALTGLGEPFTHPRIIDAIRYCKKRGLVVKVTSNGLLLRNDSVIKELIVSGLDAITFSVDSIQSHEKDSIAHRDATVLDNIERLIKLKKELRSETPRINIQTVLFKNRENDIYDVIKWSAVRPIHRVNVLRMHLYFDIDEKRPTREEEKRIFREFAKLRKKYNVRIDCIQDQFFTGIMGWVYKYFKYFLRLDSCCIRLLDYPLISQKGEMLPCCVLPECSFGNVLEEDIKRIWHGKKIAAFRKTYNTVERCSKCDCWRIKQVI